MTSLNSQIDKQHLGSLSAQHSFEGVAQTEQLDLADQHIGFRTTQAEKAKLLELAHGRPLGSFIRTELLGRNASKRKRRAPKHDEVILCKVLAALGNTRLSSHLGEIAKAAKGGALPVTDDLVMD